MAKYREVEKLNGAIKLNFDSKTIDWREMAVMLNIVEHCPDADVVERKKGRWLNKGRKLCCSECGITNFCTPNFCPECGADMREEKTDAENN